MKPYKFTMMNPNTNESNFISQDKKELNIELSDSQQADPEIPDIPLQQQLFDLFHTLTPLYIYNFFRAKFSDLLGFSCPTKNTQEDITESNSIQQENTKSFSKENKDRKSPIINKVTKRSKKDEPKDQTYVEVIKSKILFIPKMGRTFCSKFSISTFLLFILTISCLEFLLKDPNVVDSAIPPDVSI